MKKLLLILAVILAIKLTLIFLIWWATLQAEPSVYHRVLDAQESKNQLENLDQFIKKNNITATHNRIELDELYLNKLLRYASMQTKGPIQLTAHIELEPQRSQLLLTINTNLPLRPFLNISIDFNIEGNSIIILGGRIGGIEWPKTSFDSLADMSISYAQQSPQFSSLSQIWQTIQGITISENLLAIDFAIDKKYPLALPHQQANHSMGKIALERLNYYQTVIENSFEKKMGQRVKLHEVMRLLFSHAVTEQQQGADPIADNKAIILALFTHTADAKDFSALALEEAISLPSQPIELTIERRHDLARHFLATATITLLANSAIADAIGLYKELQDQSNNGQFSVSDLMADHAGSLFASKLFESPEAATSLQIRLASSKNEQAFFPATQVISDEFDQLLADKQQDQQQLLALIAQRINHYALSATIYQ